MNILELNTNIITNLVSLTTSQVGGFTSIVALLGDQTCEFTGEFDGTEYTGDIRVSSDGQALLLAFDQPDVIIGTGTCLSIECSSDDSTDTGEESCINEVVEVTDQMKLSVVGEDGCPIGHTTVAAIKSTIVSDIVGQFSICELLGVDQIPPGNLTSVDKILTSTGCSLKLVPAEDLKCPEQ